MITFIFLLVSNLACCSILKMEAIFFSETSVDSYQDTALYPKRLEIMYIIFRNKVQKRKK
jgi:hypothetical protein